MRYHVHGKLDHAGLPIDFSISLNALTEESAELYVRDLFLEVLDVEGPAPFPVIDELEITGIDVELELPDRDNVLSLERAALARRRRLLAGRRK